MCQQLNETNFWDKAAVIYFLARINMPIDRWKAYKLGIIDKNFNVIKSPVSAEEKRAFGSFDRLIAWIRRVVPSSILLGLSAYGAYKILTESEAIVAEDTKNTLKLNELYMKFVVDSMHEGISFNEINQFLNGELNKDG